jgi:16S rRNA (guanine966-N2)-methyltransferase
MRVVGGRFSGRVLQAPPGRRTRPTTDRVREALFSILGDVSNEAVADLFAGTGALGIEALSRGARHAAFVESWRPAVAAIRANVRALALEASSSVLPVAVERARTALEQHAPFELIFCDPPWADMAGARVALERLRVAELMTPSGCLIVEHPADEPFHFNGDAEISVEQSRRWGDTAISFFVRR